MRIPRRIVGRSLAVALALGASAAAALVAQASPVVLRPLPIPAVQYCAAVVGHVPGASGASPLLGRACSADSREDALARSDGWTR